MLPYLFRWGDFGLHTYTLLYSLSFFVCLGVWIKLTRKYHYSVETLVNITIQTFFVSLLGARVLYLLTQWPKVLSGELNPWHFWEGGVVFFGGLLAGGPFLLYRLRKYSLNPKTALNTLSPALCFAHALGRLGCFANGCCYGRDCAYFWAVTYTNPLSNAPLHEPLHPTQIYEIIGLIILGLALVRRCRRDLSGDFSNLKLYLIGYSALRFGVEFFRGDEIRGFWWGLSTSQWISLAVIFAALLLDLRPLTGHKSPHES